MTIANVNLHILIIYPHAQAMQKCTLENITYAMSMQPCSVLCME